MGLEDARLREQDENKIPIMSAQDRTAATRLADILKKYIEKRRAAAYVNSTWSDAYVPNICLATEMHARSTLAPHPAELPHERRTIPGDYALPAQTEA